ncbi:MAG TPA: hypothetical protein VNU97_00330 [Rhizomicrobium sp.]|jgi:hypothetical protein|nr:hypothetical protein [Rhizomicrobium sp.]
MRLLAALFALLAAAAAARAADVPDSAKSTYFIVRARFVPKEALPNPDGPDPYIGVKVKGDVAVTAVLAGQPSARHFTAELWLPRLSGRRDLYLLLEQAWEGAPEIAAWSPVGDGFCIAPDQALDGPVAEIVRLRLRHPCRRKP